MSSQRLIGTKGKSAAAIAAICLALLPAASWANPPAATGSASQSERQALALAAPTAPREPDYPLLAERLRRQIVRYETTEATGTIVIDTRETYLYYVLGRGLAIRYGIGVGRRGFTWSGVKAVARMSEWPDWLPPAEMIERQPYLPRFMAGGPHNPLGARAIYLSGTLYRIHGTNAPATIGQHVSSGCIRMLNEDVIDLYARVHIGTKVAVLPMAGSGHVVGQSSNAVQSEAGNRFNAFILY